MLHYSLALSVLKLPLCTLTIDSYLYIYHLPHAFYQALSFLIDNLVVSRYRDNFLMKSLATLLNYPFDASVRLANESLQSFEA
jgi:hypothetical protein